MCSDRIKPFVFAEFYSDIVFGKKVKKKNEMKAIAMKLHDC